MIRTRFLRWAASVTLTVGLLASCQSPGLTTSAGISSSRSVTVPPGSTSAFVQAGVDAHSWLTSQLTQTGTGLVDSFEDYSAPNTPIPISYSYDQAVAIIAFLLEGDVANAKVVLNTMQAIQGADGAWVNSYYNNSTAYGGQELRKHVGVVVWMALAVMNYEQITGDLTTYHTMATKALDWTLQFAKSNGALSGGMTTWDSGNGSWTNEVWSSTEHNIDAYAALTYFAATTPSKASTYTSAAANSKSFLDNVVWDGTKNRFRGGFKNNTNTIDPNVPMDVNPWGVQALGVSGTHNYGSTLDYVENANANPGTTPDNPRYVENLSYGTGTINLYDFDWESDGAAGSSSSGGGTLGPDVWFEGSAFMSVSHRMRGESTKADSIISEMIKKQGKDGSKVGGVPYSLNGTNNNYWKMSNQNCISSTGWLIIAIHQWNPFTGTPVGPVNNQTAAPTFSPAGGTYTSAQTVTLSSATSGATIRYTLDGSTPTSSSATYSSPLTVSTSKTIKAYASKSGLTDSTVSSASYTIQISGDFTQSAAASGANVGLTFVSNVNSLWVDTHFFTSKNAGQQNFRMVQSGNTWTENTTTSPALATGDTVTYWFTYEKAGLGYDTTHFTYTVGGDQTQAAAPTFSPAGGTYSSTQTVTLSSATSGATIRYTLDGSTPTPSSATYSSPLTVSSSKTIKAFASKSGLTDSTVSSATYAIQIGGDFTQSATASGSNIGLTFVSNVNSVWVDTHFFTSKNSGQQNFRMVQSGSTWTENTTTSPALATGDTVTYWFTYEKAGLAYDTTHFSYTVQ